MIKEKSCGAIVYKKVKNEYLFLVLRQRAGHYSFPKGHVEGNETEEETAYREILEESNIKTKIDTNFRQVITYTVKENIIKDVVYFVAEYIYGIEKPQESEVQSVMWVNKEDALNLITYDNAREVFKKALNYLKG